MKSKFKVGDIVKYTGLGCMMTQNNLSCSLCKENIGKIFKIKNTLSSDCVVVEDEIILCCDLDLILAYPDPDLVCKKNK